MANYCWVYGVIHFTSPAGWLPVDRDQLRAQRSVTSMGKLYLFLPLTVHVLCLCTFRCRLLRLYVYPHIENGKIWQSTFTVSDCWQKTSGKIRISFWAVVSDWCLNLANKKGRDPTKLFTYSYWESSSSSSSSSSHHHHHHHHHYHTHFYSDLNSKNYCKDHCFLLFLCMHLHILSLHV